jgi:hypothetical protein
MKRYVFLIAVTSLMGSGLAWAQQAPSPQPASPPATAERPAAPPSPPSNSQPSSVAPNSPVATAPSGPITINIPSPIKIEATSTGGGGSGSGWLTFLGVIVTAGVSGWVGYQTAKGAAEMRAQTKELAIQEREVKVELAHLELATRVDQFEKEQAEKRRQANRTHVIERGKMGIEEKRIAIELERLGFQSGVSDNEGYLAATRFVHEQQFAEAELIRSFSDRLLGVDERERLFALFVLSAYVNPEVIRRLAAGGEEIISTASLKKLAAVGDYEISAVAQSILEHRKSGASAEISDPSL